MIKCSFRFFCSMAVLFMCALPFKATAQVVISQYYEGAGTNKWIELTNLGTSAVNTASPQLKLALWAVPGSTGNIVFTGAASNTYNLTVTIPAKGSVLIGTSSNGTEVPYLTAASANETANAVINFNGNDGVALLDASNNIIDKFGEGINAADISYVRSAAVTAPNAVFTLGEWTSTSLAAVQTAGPATTPRLGYQLAAICAVPAAAATALNFSGISSSSINGSFTAASGADGYLVVQSSSSSLSGNPINGSSYIAGNSMGGGVVLSSGAATSFSSTGLSANTTYYFFVFSYNNANCSNGPKYLTSSILSASQATAYPPCAAPANNASALLFTGVTSSAMNVSFTAAAGADGYLVVRSTASSLSAGPANGTAYTNGNSIGGGTVVSTGNTLAFAQTGLAAATTYYFYVFAYTNVNCTGAPAYKTTPLSGSRATDPATLSFYFGNLHAHSKYSDGNKDDTTKTPADNYAFAKNAMCLDFLGISEHNHAGAGMSLGSWQPGITQAAAATTSTFIALHGQEWGIIGTTGAAGDHAGHVVVYGMDSLMGWEAGNYQVNVPKNTYTGTGGLFDIINRHGNNAFATLAHPDNYDYNNILNIAYDVNADNAIVGSAIESGPAFSADTTYTDPAAIGYYAFYKNMLAKGYHMGPTIDHDNHNMTFGKTAKTRLAILAYSLSEANLLDAMRKMRFYATDDCNAKVNFTINTAPIGSIITKPGAPNIAVTTITTNTVTSLKLMYGVPGSGSSPTTLTSVTTGSLTYTHTALANLATGYYFLDITETGGARIITAPIWYTRDNSASRPIFVTSLFTVNENDRVILKWTAQHEPLNESYEIQRSTDGRNFIVVGTADGKSAGSETLNYAIEDLQPYDGLAYYRLVSKGADGTLLYSELKEINRSGYAVPYFVLYPNPVHDVLTVKINSTKADKANIALLDMSGRLVKNISLNLNRGEQYIQLPVGNISAGTYVLKLQFNNSILTQQLNKF